MSYGFLLTSSQTIHPIHLWVADYNEKLEGNEFQQEQSLKLISD